MHTGPAAAAAAAATATTNCHKPNDKKEKKYIEQNDFEQISIEHNSIEHNSIEQHNRRIKKNMAKKTTLSRAINWGSRKRNSGLLSNVSSCPFSTPVKCNKKETIIQKRTCKTYNVSLFKLKKGQESI